MKTARFSAAALLVVASALIAGCPGQTESGAKGAAKAKGAKDAAVTEVADAKGPAADGPTDAPSKDAPGTDAPADAAADAAGKDVVAAAAKEGGDHEGCIYVGTEKDAAKGEAGEQLECPHGPGEAAAADAQDGHFGAPFTLASAKPLSAAVTGKADEAPIQVSGEVEAVCQKKGCWMVVKDGPESARVLMKDHAFAVPMDSRGKKVTVEGTLATRTFTEKQVKHLEKDGGGDPEKVAGERTEHVLTATGIRIQS